MKSGKPLLRFLILIVMMVAGIAFGQVWVRSVDIPCYVTNRAGQFITDLKQEDFVVRDNGKIQKITGFKEKLQAPLSVALLIDRSRSVTQAFPLLQSASEKFLGSIIRKNVDRSCIVAFDSHVYLLQDWTDELGLLDQAIGKLTASGGTALFDAIYKTCRDKFPPEQDEDRTKVLLLVTDGEDTTSHATLKQVTDMVSQSGVIIYVLGIHAQDSLNPRSQQGKRVLTEFKDTTGGDVLYQRGNEANLEDLFGQIERELRNEYIVTFVSNDEPDGTFHKLKIETNRKDLVVRARKKGYLASG
jgi:VWFA-related protein